MPRLKALFRVSFLLGVLAPFPSARAFPQEAGPVDSGTYLVTLVVGGREMSRSITVEPDIWMGQTH